jgi:hypothetical protein
MPDEGLFGPGSATPERGAVPGRTRRLFTANEARTRFVRATEFVRIPTYRSTTAAVERIGRRHATPQQ